MRSVAPDTPTTAGTWYSRAMTELWFNTPPISVTHRAHAPEERGPARIGTQRDQNLPLRQHPELLGSANDPCGSARRPRAGSDALQPLRILVFVRDRILATPFDPEIKRISNARAFEIRDPPVNFIFGCHGAAAERVLNLVAGQEKHVIFPPKQSSGYKMIPEPQKNSPVPGKESVEVKSQFLT